MTRFAFVTRPSGALDKYLTNMENKLAGEGMVVAPYSGRVRHDSQADKTICLIELEPRVPPVYYLGIMLLALWAVFRLWTLLWLGIIFLAPVVFWSAPFYYLLIKIQLWRAGHPAPIRWASRGRLIKVLMDVTE